MSKSIAQRMTEKIMPLIGEDQFAAYGQIMNDNLLDTEIEEWLLQKRAEGVMQPLPDTLHQPWGGKAWNAFVAGQEADYKRKNLVVLMSRHIAHEVLGEIMDAGGVTRREHPEYGPIMAGTMSRKENSLKPDQGHILQARLEEYLENPKKLGVDFTSSVVQANSRYDCSTLILDFSDFRPKLLDRNMNPAMEPQVPPVVHYELQSDSGQILILGQDSKLHRMINKIERKMDVDYATENLNGDLGRNRLRDKFITQRNIVSLNLGDNFPYLIQDEAQTLLANLTDDEIEEKGLTFNYVSRSSLEDPYIASVEAIADTFFQGDVDKVLGAMDSHYDHVVKVEGGAHLYLSEHWSHKSFTKILMPHCSEQMENAYDLAMLIMEHPLDLAPDSLREGGVIGNRKDHVPDLDTEDEDLEP